MTREQVTFDQMMMIV